MKNLNLMTLLILLTLMGCSGEKAQYKKDPSFGNLNEEQLVSKFTLKSDLSHSFVDNLHKKMRANFNWKTFWNKMNEAASKPQSKVQSSQIISLLSRGHEFCPTGTKDTIVSIYNSLGDSEVEEIKIWPSIEMIIRKCPGKLTQETKKTLRKKLRRTFFAQEETERLQNIEAIVSIDKALRQNSQSNQSFNYTFTAREFATLGQKMIDEGNANQFLKYLNIHRKLWPRSSSFRTSLLSSAIKNDDAFKRILSNNTLNEILTFLVKFSSKEGVKLPSQQFNNLFSTILKKFKQKYTSSSIFENKSKLISNAWNSYTKIFKSLSYINTEKQKAKLRHLNRLEKVIENILSYKPAWSLDFLSHIYGEYAHLSYFYELRIRKRYFEDENFSTKEINLADKTLLDELIFKRIKVLTSKNKSTSLESYCDLLELEFDIPRTTITLSDIKPKLHSESYGCHEILTTERSNKPFSIIKNKVVTPFDLAFTIKGKDISLKTNYYDGPIWNLSSKPHEKQYRLRQRPELDGQFSPIFIKATVHQHVEGGLKKGKYLLIFNYGFEKPRKAPPQEAFNLQLETGYRGGDFEIVVKNHKSYYPTLISNGGRGQKGPKTLNSGEGFNNDKLEQTVWNILPDKWTTQRNINYYIFSPGQIFYERLQKSDPGFEIIWTLSNRFSQDYCGKRRNSLELCFVKGQGSELKQFKKTEGEIIETFREKIEDLILTNSEEFYKNVFRFSPIHPSLSTKTEFPDGQRGKNGQVIYTRQ